MTLYCNGPADGCLIRHNDQHRGVDHSFTAAGGDPGDTVYTEPNPDYYRLLDLGNGRLTPVGYGHRSVEFIVDAIRRLEKAAGENLEQRRAFLRQLDEAGIVATPANSAYNELVIEAGRLSITQGGREALIEYQPEPRVVLA
jgi:hypothetical protein